MRVRIPPSAPRLQIPEGVHPLTRRPVFSADFGGRSPHASKLACVNPSGPAATPATPKATVAEFPRPLSSPDHSILQQAQIEIEIIIQDISEMIDRRDGGIQAFVSLRSGK